ncbi:hypothetical protein [Streptomyces sp. NPDC021212]
MDLIEQAGLRPAAELRLLANKQHGPVLVVMAKRPAADRTPEVAQGAAS